MDNDNDNSNNIVTVWGERACPGAVTFVVWLFVLGYLLEVRRALSRILRASPSRIVYSGAVRNSPLGIGSAALMRRSWQSGALSRAFGDCPCFA